MITLEFRLLNNPYQCPPIVGQLANAALGFVPFLCSGYFLMEAFLMLITNGTQVEM
jgi:hypothetical protein